MTQISDFERSVKHGMIDKGYTAKTLCEEVKKTTGLYCDTSYLSKMYRGKMSGGRVKEAIIGILGI